MDPLAQPADVNLLLESPLDSSQDARLEALIAVASLRLRQRAPWLDDRIAKFEADNTAPAGLDPDLVATVVAGIVARFLNNTDGATSVTKSQSVGSYSLSNTRAFSGKNAPPVGLRVLDDDVSALAVSPTSQPTTIRTRSTHPFPPYRVRNRVLDAELVRELDQEYGPEWCDWL